MYSITELPAAFDALEKQVKALEARQQSLETWAPGFDFKDVKKDIWGAFDVLEARLKELEKRAPGFDFQAIKDDIEALKEEARPA